MKSSGWLYLSLIALTSCLQEIDVEISEDVPNLVVDGYINNQNEVHTVKLSTISTLNGLGGNVLGVGATVQIQEFDGPKVTLTETVPGTYQLLAGALVGQVGKSYQLLVQLANGDEYISTFETIQDPITTLGGTASLKKETIQQENGTFSTSIFHEITIDLENQEDDYFYLLENSGWAEVEIGYGDCGLFAPPAAGPSVCWSLRSSLQRTLPIGTNLALSKGDYTILSAIVPFDAKRPYVAISKIHAISSSNFRFWQSVNSQLNREGGLFDRPFAPIVGNITNTSNNKPALGYFHAYATSTEIVCFDRSEIEGTVTSPGPIPCPTLCTSVWAPATFDNIADLFCQ
ncbi:MAG: DUF4249 domain-containing protein [Cyclobacteriaceae bacterium]